MPTQTPATKVVFAAIKPGMTVTYAVMVGEQEILSHGEVFGIRRVGRNSAEVTLLHAKTGALFVNVVKGNDTVIVHSPAFAPLAATHKETMDVFVLALRDQVQRILSQNVKDFYDMLITD